MAGTSVSFSMDMSNMRRGIDKAIAHIRNRRTLAEELGEAFVSSVKERFEKGKGPDGRPWVKSQRAEKGGQTLVDSGLLRNSIGYEASPLAVVIGTPQIYGRIHQKGGQAGRNHAVTIPARPFLGFSKEDMQEAEAIIQDFIARGFAW